MMDDPEQNQAECADAVTRLYEYLDGELDAATMQAVADHLRRCSPCLEMFDFQAELREVVKSKCAESMPADLRCRILGMIGGSDTQSSQA